jgi:hypothetical protein
MMPLPYIFSILDVTRGKRAAGAIQGGFIA